MDKLKYIDDLFESKLEGAEITPDSAAWDNIANRLDNINPSHVDIQKSNYRVKLVSVASVILVAIASVLLIRSCDSLPAQSNSKYGGEFNNYAESNINRGQNYLASSLVSSKPNHSSNDEILFVNSASNAVIKNDKSSELVSENIDSQSKMIKTESEENRNTIVKSANQEIDIEEKSDFSIAGLKKFKLRGLQLDNDFEIENTLEKFPTNHKLFMFDKRLSKEFSVEIAYGHSFVRNGQLVANDVLNSANKISGNTLFDYNISVNFKYEVNKFFFKSGVNFNSLFEKGVFEFSEEMIDTSKSHYTYEIDEYITYDSVDWWVNPDDPNDTLVYYEPVQNIDTVNVKWNRVDSAYHKDYQKQIETSLRYIEIPLMIGYRHQFNRFSLAVSNGIGLAVKVGDEGYIVQADEIRQITRSNSPYNDVVLNYIFAFDMSYKLNQRTSIFISPNYRTNLNSIYKKQIGDSRVYHSFGISAGLNFVIK